MCDLTALQQLCSLVSDDEEMFDIHLDARALKDMELKESEEARKRIVFNLNSISEVKSVETFRIAKADIPVVARKFLLLAKIESNRVCRTRVEGL